MKTKYFLFFFPKKSSTLGNFLIKMAFKTSSSSLSLMNTDSMTASIWFWNSASWSL
jgi:hypothetical protein